MDTKIDENGPKPKLDYSILKNELDDIDFKNYNFDNFEDNLNISDIKDELQKSQEERKDSKQHKKDSSNRIYPESSFDKDFSIELDNINGDEFNIRKISICSLQSEEFNCNSNFDNKMNKKLKRKITKDDLNNIPLPVFSCIYCSNEEISFRHLSLEKLSNKYLLQSSVYDILELNKLIEYNPMIDKDDKNEKLFDIIIKNSEYINKYNGKEIVNNFFKSNYYFNMCNKELFNYKINFVHKIEDNIVKKRKDFYFKGINKISKNSLNNKCLFNSTNCSINNNNVLSGFFETNFVNNITNIGKNNNNNCSNISSINFNSISSNNNENGNYYNKDSNNFLMSIVEKIENNAESGNEIEDKEEIIDFFKFDLSRKIKKEDIIWENDYYDIWNPNFSYDDINKISNSISLKEKKYNKNLKLKVNLKSNFNDKYNILNNSFFNQLNQKLSISHIKDKGSTCSSSEIIYEKENKMNSYYNNSKDYIKNYLFITDKENIKKNSSSTNNDIITLKFYNKINNISNNMKINQRYIKDTSINKPEININISKNNKNYHSSKESNINFSGSDNKQKNKGSKIISLNKIKKKKENKIIIINDIKKLKANNIERTLDNYNPNLYFNNSSTIAYKEIKTGGNILVKTPNSTKRGVQITSSKIKYKHNNKTININKNGQTINLLSPKQNISKFEEFKTFNKNNKRMDEFMKLNTNRTIYQQINYKKINSNIVISKRYTKLYKSQDKLKNESRNGIVIRRNTENKKMKFKNRTKISINKNNIIFPSFNFKNSILNNY